MINAAQEKIFHMLIIKGIENLPALFMSTYQVYRNLERGRIILKRKLKDF